LERLAKRICKAANARDTKDVDAVIATFKQRSKVVVVDAAVAVAVAKGWLRVDGSTYALTQVGVDMGRQSRAGQRARRVIPF
jgi:hypothetical protein